MKLLEILVFIFHSKLNMEHHVKKLCQACHYHLRNIGKIRNLIDAHTTHMLVYAFITSCLDYCISLLVGIPKFLKERLQKIKNKAARLITRKGEDDSKTILKELHWLPIEARIDFKIACHVYKCLHGLAPPPPPLIFQNYFKNTNIYYLNIDRRQNLKNVLFTSMALKFGKASQ